MKKLYIISITGKNKTKQPPDNLLPLQKMVQMYAVFTTWLKFKKKNQLLRIKERKALYILLSPIINRMERGRGIKRSIFYVTMPYLAERGFFE